MVGDKEEVEEVEEMEATRGEMVRAVTGIIYLTGRETKRTKHCRGVAPQTEPPWWEEERDGRRGGGRGGTGTERTKTWNKSPHFCSLESFSNYGRSGEGRGGEGGGGRRWRAKRGASVIYTSPRFRNY